MIIRRLGLLLVVGSVVLMAACGGSGGGGSSVTSVTVSCSPGTVTSGGTSQCTAIVNGTGSFNTAVNWSASAGSISSTGLLTAPQVTTSLVDTITATSVQNQNVSGTATVTVNPASGGGNVAPLVVDQGPEPQTFLSTNVAFTTVTVCVPGTTTCQTIDHVMVDTGSTGLRLISGVLQISLPGENGSSGTPLDECQAFLDGYVWGPVVTADISMGGETATAVPLQVMIPSTSSPPVPGSCSSNMGPNEGGSVQTFGANGLIGVGLFQQDCGPYCVSQGATCESNNSTCVYYQCPSSSGCVPTNVGLPQQVTNPVFLFPTDNNGVLIQLPSVPDGGSPTVQGSLIFGIGTESNNGLGGAQVYVVPDSGNNAGNFTTLFNNNNYPGFTDSGSNGYFFVDSGIPNCGGNNSSWFCPANSPDNLSAGNQGTTMNSPVTVNFSIENANNLFNTSNTAFSTLGGPFPSGSSPAFDWGLSFFYGRNVFTGIENTSVPGTNIVGPYFAF